MQVTATTSTVNKVKLPDATAALVSEQLLRSPARKQQKMIETLLNAGVRYIEGWAISELVTGRINPNTGDRVLPSGVVASNRASDAASGRYWGSKTYSPVTSLHQTGVIWE